jgi:ubiquinone/menaquinone biosynthesis C-methylase UbiE
LKYVIPDWPWNSEKRIILDVGCGDGSLLKYLYDIYGPLNEFYGMDASQKLIDVAVKKYAPKLRFRIGEIEAIAFPSNSVDRLLCSFVFHHLPTKIKQKGIKEIYRVLKPGGYLMYIDVGKPENLYSKIIMNLFTRHFEHIGSQMNNEVLVMMLNEGFLIEKIIIKTVLNGQVYCVQARKE